MEEKDRYVLSFEDNGFDINEGVFAYLYDNKNQNYIIVCSSINNEDAVTLCNLLNTQDKLINVYKKNLKDLLSKFFDYMKTLAEFDYDCDITPNDFSLLKKYLTIFRFAFKEEFFDFYQKISKLCD